MGKMDRLTGTVVGKSNDPLRTVEKQTRLDGVLDWAELGGLDGTAGCV